MHGAEGIDQSPVEQRLRRLPGNDDAVVVEQLGCRCGPVLRRRLVEVAAHDGDPSSRALCGDVGEQLGSGGRSARLRVRRQDGLDVGHRGVELVPGVPPGRPVAVDLPAVAAREVRGVPAVLQVAAVHHDLRSVHVENRLRPPAADRVGGDDRIARDDPGVGRREVLVAEQCGDLSGRLTHFGEERHVGVGLRDDIGDLTRTVGHLGAPVPDVEGEHVQAALPFDLGLRFGRGDRLRLLVRDGEIDRPGQHGVAVVFEQVDVVLARPHRRRVAGPAVPTRGVPRDLAGLVCDVSPVEGCRTAGHRAVTIDPDPVAIVHRRAGVERERDRLVEPDAGRVQREHPFRRLSGGNDEETGENDAGAEQGEEPPLRPSGGGHDEKVLSTTWRIESYGRRMTGP